MNKKIILLILALLASKIYGMEPAPLSPAKKYQQIEEKYQQMFPEKYELIRNPKGTFLATLPADLQKELIQYHYVLYQKVLNDEYGKLTHQKTDSEENMYIPSYDIFKDLIEFRGLILEQGTKHHYNDEWVSQSGSIRNLLILHNKFNILKLFIEKQASKNWDGLAKAFYRELQYNKSNHSESEIQGYLDLLQTLIDKELGLKDFVSVLYNHLLKEHPEFKPIAQKLRKNKMENWEKIAKRWFSKWF